MKNCHAHKVVCASKAVVLGTDVKLVIIQVIFIAKDTDNEQ